MGNTPRITSGARPRSATRRLVLLVEDFDDARELYAEYLTCHGLEVICVGNGADAVQRAIERHPAVIVMDAGLPAMSGWEASRVLKNEPRTRAIPIVMLTGHVFGDAEMRAKDAGVDVFLRKPCLPDVLLRHIVAALRTAGKRAPTPGVSAEGPWVMVTDRQGEIVTIDPVGARALNVSTRKALMSNFLPFVIERRAALAADLRVVAFVPFPARTVRVMPKEMRPFDASVELVGVEGGLVELTITPFRARPLKP